MVAAEALNEERRRELVEINELYQQAFSQEEDIYICPDCLALLVRGDSQLRINWKIDKEMASLERSRARGGSGGSNRRVNQYGAMDLE